MNVRTFLSVSIYGFQSLDIKVSPKVMIWIFYLWYNFLQFSVVSGVHCGISFPWYDASQDELVAFYRHHLYTVSDILCVLLFRHHMVTSRRSVNRIIKRLGISMRQNQHPLVIILCAIQHLHASGYSDVGYRTIWRILNVTLELRFLNVQSKQFCKLLTQEFVEALPIAWDAGYITELVPMGSFT